jgi:hypothetical protein
VLGEEFQRVTHHYGLRWVRRPIGFKHLTAALASGEVDVAGEESRGFAWAPFARDKDAILAGALLAEIVASTGAPLARRLAELATRHGAPACGRLSLPLGVSARTAFARLGRSVPRRFDGARARRRRARRPAARARGRLRALARVRDGAPAARLCRGADAARAGAAARRGGRARDQALS